MLAKEQQDRPQTIKRALQQLDKHVHLLIQLHKALATSPPTSWCPSVHDMARPSITSRWDVPCPCPHLMVAQRARHGQAAWPHAQRPHGTPLHSAAADFAPRGLQARALGRIVVQAVVAAHLCCAFCSRRLVSRSTSFGGPEVAVHP